MKTRVFVVDDHPMVRHGLTALINPEPDLEICGEAGSAVAALGPILKLRPNVAIVDLSLDDGSGMDLIKNVRSHDPRIAIVVLSVHPEEEFGLRALRAGALAYVSKADSGAHVLEAIRSAHGGHFYVDENTSRILIEESVRKRHSASGKQENGNGALTDREIEVMNLIGRGHSTLEIANSLRLSVKTVESHRAHLKRKLHVATAIQLVRACVLKTAESGVPARQMATVASRETYTAKDAPSRC